MELTKAILDEFNSYLKTIKYKNKISILKLEFLTDEIGDYIYLLCIKIKPSQQQKGYGDAVLDDIIQIADKYNVRIRLWATDIYGVSLKALYGFYGKHGFSLIKDELDGHMIYHPKKIRKH